MFGNSGRSSTAKMSAVSWGHSCHGNCRGLLSKSALAPLLQVMLLWHQWVSLTLCPLRSGLPQELCVGLPGLCGGGEDPVAEVAAIPAPYIGQILHCPLPASLHPNDSSVASTIGVLAGRSTCAEELHWLASPEHQRALQGGCQKHALRHVYSIQGWHWASANGAKPHRIRLWVKTNKLSVVVWKVWIQKHGRVFSLRTLKNTFEEYMRNIFINISSIS